jgi:hypothetical protein
MVTCDDSSNDGFEEFNLESLSLNILGAQAPAKILSPAINIIA